MSKQHYKFLYLKDGKITSDRKNHVWDIGKTYTVGGDIKACRNGFHASEYIQDALGYVYGDVLAVVEGSGDSDTSESDKVCYRSMKIVKAYKWTQADNITFAIYCAEQVIKIYEDKYPNDSRPRDAMKAAKAYLKDPSKKNKDVAADAAYAAHAAADAADAAHAAADAADAAADAADAAYAAHAAAYAAHAAADAAYAAHAAADAAHAAAYAAAYAELRAKLHRFAKNHIKKLEQL